jgi:tetratricopeptide (TPR) repeat protein
MEASLRFAIPLSSPYQHRGTAAPGSSLGPRGTDFSLRGLGGGQRVDGWDLGAYQAQLRASYLRAAAQEVAAGHFQKAAYIHAHLLGDYRAAAQVLVQGRYFREAAALYREHLHDPGTAAATLEQGGLLAEALEIYRELNAYEKVGDLHCALGQPARAILHYERAAAEAQAADNLLIAANILANKLLRPTEAETLLLAGWASPRKPEAHLKQYLLLLTATRPADLPAAVRTLAELHTPPGRRVQLLELLLTGLPTRPTDAALQAAVQQLGYEIISQEAVAGRPKTLHLLQKLLPHDRLLPGDASRYATRPPTATR